MLRNIPSILQSFYHLRVLNYRAITIKTAWYWQKKRKTNGLE
jgi:hypothetical protein